MRRDERVHCGDARVGRWERLLNDTDDAGVWKAMEGDVSMDGFRNTFCPTDQDFKTHFESVLNPIDETEHGLDNLINDVTIPVLDEPITPAEVHEQARKMKPDKASGPDGIPPGVFTLLPVQWIYSLVALFNSIFLSGNYPQSWMSQGIHNFRKGDRSNPSNYRGISVINTLGKLYDMVLCQRLSLWFKPYREQAGAQEQRRCIEHIVTFRILTDMARWK